eukprot:1128142_1
MEEDTNPHHADENGQFLDILPTGETINDRYGLISGILPDDDDDDSDGWYDVYATHVLPTKSTTKSHTYAKLNTPTSTKEPPTKQKTHDRKTVCLLCALIWCLIAIPIALYLLHRFDIVRIGPEPDGEGLEDDTSTWTTTLPTSVPSNDPTLVPTSIPTPIPTNFPTITPTVIPSTIPTITPTNTPSSIPTLDPTAAPSKRPTAIPTTRPTAIPTAVPTATPTMIPTAIPTSTPTMFPSTNPSNSPTIGPSKTPTDAPSLVPTMIPTTTPSDIPTVTTTVPTRTPTQSPITRISRSGNDIIDQGIEMNFPPDAFPDSVLTITIGEATDSIKALFEDTTSSFRTLSMDNVKDNAIHFEVGHMPLDIANINITYKTTIPIPSDLVTQCPNDYGFEIFAKVEEKEFPQTTRPTFILFESEYNPSQRSLTTFLVSQIFIDFVADIVLSCTPGVNIVPSPGRRLLQNPNFATDCKAAEIRCPIQSRRCIKLQSFSRHHAAVDYVSRGQSIVTAANGIVERNGTSLTYGNVVTVRNEDGSAIVYGNLDEIEVNKGQTVVSGETIAISNPTHVHIEYVPNGEIYASKKRIDASDCFAPFVETRSPGSATTQTPTRSPLVPPNTHSPTPSPTLYLPTGSITVRDSGRLADDSFAVYIDEFKVCETEIGQLNTCAISFIRPGLHALTLEVLIAPDGFGTFAVQLSDGWVFTDNTTSKNAITDLNGFEPFEGWKGSWNLTVPFTNTLP